MGKYQVPENIRKMKPKGTIVKLIHNKYYVYEHFYKKDENNIWKTKSGKLLGYIEEQNGFVPNNNFILSEEISTLEYGQYAVAINNSQKTLNRLLVHFNPIDAYCIYLMAIIHIVNNFVPLKDIHKYIEQSYISIKYPNIKFSYYHLSNLLDALGRRQGKVQEFEQSLLDDSSKEIAIDGHDIKSSSHENDLADLGNKFSSFKDSQLNVLMAYDINTNLPLISRTYPGSILDKVSIKDLLEFNDYHDMLFIVDRGFYSEDNIRLFSQNNNHYIIPLSPNLKIYKEVTKNMEFHDIFLYEASKKSTPIEYKKVDIDSNTQVIICRDLTQNAKDKADYLKNIERNPDKYNKETFEKIKDFFGVIVLQTNLNKDANTIFKYYKKRWSIETFFNYFKNRIDFNTIGLNDYYATQGMSFIMLITGLIYQELKEATKQINGKSIEDCLLEARFIKLNKKENNWVISNAKKDLQNLMSLLNTDLCNPLNK